MTAWTNLSSREKLLVGIGLPLVLIIIFYLYFWQPTRDELARLQRLVPEKTATLAWMNHQLQQPQINQGTKIAANQGGPLLSEVEIWFQDVVADQLFRWIDKLALNAVTIDSATVTRATPGLVTARVKLSRSP